MPPRPFRIRHWFSPALARDFAAFLVLCVVAWILGFATHALLASPKASVAAELSLDEFRAAVRDRRGLILDVRPESEFRTGHIPGAVSFPGHYFEGAYLHHAAELEADKSRPIIVYCAGGGCGAGHAVQRELIRLGHGQVSVFAGGWMVWAEGGFSVEAGP